MGMTKAKVNMNIVNITSIAGDTTCETRGVTTCPITLYKALVNAITEVTVPAFLCPISGICNPLPS